MERLLDFMPSAGTAFVAIIVLGVAGRLLLRKGGARLGNRFGRQVVLLLMTAAAALAVILLLPVRDQTRGQLLNLFGLAFTAVIALSSTTVVANAMAGFMLRSVRRFRIGDFISVEKQFGRVTEAGLFHTEIQTEERDLITVPNLYLLSHPVRVVHSSGTMVTAKVALGYDVSRKQIEQRLIEAAETAELDKPYVQVLDLGDFSVTYKVAGFLAEAKHMLTVRSKLRKCMLDSLHGDGIEIVSPTHMFQRPLPHGTSVIPFTQTRPEVEKPEDVLPEDVVFDKAEAAESIESMKSRREQLEAEIKQLEKKMGQASGDEKERLTRHIEHRRNQIGLISARIKAGEEPDHNS
jgi:small-conductance mechanosensitive channel